MGTRVPKGTFVRGRRDWDLDSLRLGTVHSAGDTNCTRCTLYNDSSTGSFLAVYAVLAWRSTYPQTFTIYTAQGSVGGAGAVVQQLVPGAPSISGQLLVDGGVFSEGQPGNIIFVGDGKTWLTLGDVPLAIIAPGSRCSVRNFQGANSFPIGDPTAVTFLWGYYKRSRTVTLPTPPAA